jgi:hypothetical protein
VVTTIICGPPAGRPGMPTLIPAVPGMPLVIPGPGFVITIVCFPPTPGALLTVTMFVGIVFIVVSTFAVAPPKEAHKNYKNLLLHEVLSRHYFNSSYFLQSAKKSNV